MPLKQSGECAESPAFANALRRAVASQVPRTRAQRVVAGLLGATGAAMMVLPVSRWVGPEPHWWATVLNYLPGLIWVVPWVGIGLICLVWARHWLWIPLLGIAFVLGPWMGFTLPLRGLGDEEGGTALRVMTYNAHGAKSEGIQQEIARNAPDILFAQEFAGEPELSTDGGDAWHRAESRGARIFSRYPLTRVEERELPNSGGRTYVCAEARVDQRPVAVYGVHLDTPRWAFEELIGRKVAGIAPAEKLLRERVEQAELVAREVGKETIPVIMGGDFNAPNPSRVMAAFFDAGMRETFSEGGTGFGYSYGHELRWKASHIRIDHLLVSRGFSVSRCWVGSSTASDHRAVIADLRLR